jgi:hypothetical protein
MEGAVKVEEHLMLRTDIWLEHALVGGWQRRCALFARLLRGCSIRAKCSITDTRVLRG